MTDTNFSSPLPGSSVAGSSFACSSVACSSVACSSVAGLNETGNPGDGLTTCIQTTGPGC
ncbi:hypothetical protein [Desulfobacula phenolica]|uniref:hypothetical protein n=1 Tax=Desulfobacula phenolica TaxID=90732 RepID=UPI00111448B3|nr:hypothetical protein [Desulfobacula phenolica]